MSVSPRGRFIYILKKFSRFGKRTRGDKLKPCPVVQLRRVCL